MTLRCLTFLACFISLVSIGNCEQCKNPQVTSQSFTTLDATILSHIGYVVKFSLQCDNTADIPLYAELNGAPVAVSKPASGGYLIGWSDEVKKALKGDIKINLYDEDTYAALRKVQRSGEDTSSVQPTATVTVNHPGAYSGPWINSELAATIAAVALLYIAISSRAKISA